MSISIDSGLSQAATMQSNVQNMTNGLDGKSMEDMIKLQQDMGKLQMLYGTISSVISNEKQVIQGIIQKM